MHFVPFILLRRRCNWGSGGPCA